MPRLGRKKVTKMRFRLTKNERNWVLYDVGNSAFVLLVSTIMPIYFNYLAGNAGLSSADYMAYWGYAASIVTIIVAVLGPVMGTLADTKDFKKPVFTISMLAGAAGCICLGLARQWVMFIIIYIIAKTGFSCSLIFYDSMLTDITVDERMDNVSSHGFAWGVYRKLHSVCSVSCTCAWRRKNRHINGNCNDGYICSNSCMVDCNDNSAA